MYKMSTKEPFPCSFEGCRRIFSSLSGRKRHEAVHSGNCPYRCHSCMKAFTEKSSLDEHIQAYHGSVQSTDAFVVSRGQPIPEPAAEGREATSPQPELWCTFQGCDQKFAWRHHLHYHIKTHENDRPFACQFSGCDKAFYTAQQRQVHYKTHTGERKFICNFNGCNKKFTTAQQLENHSRTHTGQKPFCCEYSGCCKAFAELSSLKKHLLVHTAEKPYPCIHCDKRFSQNSTMRTHVKRCHAEKSTNEQEQQDTSPKKITKLKPKAARHSRKKQMNEVADMEYQNVIVRQGDTVMLSSTLETQPEMCLANHKNNNGGRRVIVVSQPSSTPEMSAICDAHGVYLERVQDLPDTEQDFKFYSEISDVTITTQSEDIT